MRHAEGNADFVGAWWPQLTQWAKYLEKYGLDPEEQLCTDDFMGHLAHNANLSVKAILGLAAYGDLCRMRGDKETAERYLALARADAQHWMEVAAEGDHYRLAFDKPGTWSQKYNLVWDRILGLNVFPPSVAQKEVAHYKKMMLRYGVPLDSRTHLTKTDWSFWIATLAENRSDFEAIIAPIYDYLNATTARDPIADSYVTDDIRSGGMHARPVVGGFFIKMLTDRSLWKKWASRDPLKPANWAPLPPPQKVSVVVPGEQTWLYTTEARGPTGRKPVSRPRAGRKGEPGSERARQDSCSTRRGRPATSGCAAKSRFPMACIPIFISSLTTTRTWRFTSTESRPRRRAGSQPASCRWKSRAKRGRR